MTDDPRPEIDPSDDPTGEVPSASAPTGPSASASAPTVHTPSASAPTGSSASASAPTVHTPSASAPTEARLRDAFGAYASSIEPANPAWSATAARLDERPAGVVQRLRANPGRVAFTAAAIAACLALVGGVAVTALDDDTGTAPLDVGGDPGDAPSTGVDPAIVAVAGGDTMNSDLRWMPDGSRQLRHAAMSVSDELHVDLSVGPAATPAGWPDLTTTAPDGIDERDLQRRSARYVTSPAIKEADRDDPCRSTVWRMPDLDADEFADAAERATGPDRENAVAKYFAPRVVTDHGRTPAVSPDGTKLAYVQLDPPDGSEVVCKASIVVRDLRTGDERVWRDPLTWDPKNADTGWPAQPTTLMWAPDNRHLAFNESYEGDEVHVMDTTSDPGTLRTTKLAAPPPDDGQFFSLVGVIDADTLLVRSGCYSGCPTPSATPYVSCRSYEAYLEGNGPSSCVPAVNMIWRADVVADGQSELTSIGDIPQTAEHVQLTPGTLNRAPSWNVLFLEAGKDDVRDLWYGTIVESSDGAFLCEGDVILCRNGDGDADPATGAAACADDEPCAGPTTTTNTGVCPTGESAACNLPRTCGEHFPCGPTSTSTSTCAGTLAACAGIDSIDDGNAAGQTCDDIVSCRAEAESSDPSSSVDLSDDSFSCDSTEPCGSSTGVPAVSAGWVTPPIRIAHDVVAAGFGPEPMLGIPAAVDADGNLVAPPATTTTGPDGPVAPTTTSVPGATTATTAGPGPTSTIDGKPMPPTPPPEPLGDCSGAAPLAFTADVPPTMTPEALTRWKDILAATSGCDFESLRNQLPDTDFFGTAGGTSDELVAAWAACEDDATECLPGDERITMALRAVMAGPPTAADELHSMSGETGPGWVWPAQATWDAGRWANATDAELAPLVEAYGAETVESWQAAGVYLGHTSEMLADGTWISFVLTTMPAGRPAGTPDSLPRTWRPQVRQVDLPTPSSEGGTPDPLRRRRAWRRR